MNEHLLSGIGMTSQRTRNRLVQRLRQSGIEDEQVLMVMANTPRHVFVDEALAHRAYEDTALPIGHGQTISQPYTVARMTEVLMQAGPRSKVLEIGTGSGYQTAVLSPLVDKVYSVERIAPLQKRAQQRLRQLQLRNISLKLSDGSWGWPEAGPFDGILAARRTRSHTASPARSASRWWPHGDSGGRRATNLDVDYARWRQHSASGAGKRQLCSLPAGLAALTLGISRDV